MRKLFLSLALAGIMVSQTGCFGEFSLTRKVYEFNQNVGGKFVNELVFLAFCIIPVYEAATFVDAVILNTIEFWTGSNPLSMAPGETEIQYATVDGHQYRMTAQQNYFSVEELTANGYELRNEFRFNSEKNEMSVSNGTETGVFASK
ncbi:hypothetical protein SDC9_74412 [bioreactor metagenome]|uniref:DUF3332 domain-containing protein n=1 Tax=bioreactor metagenome TaxID=1076179 RepID=A0A644YHY5_9ZZZZ